MSNQEKSTVRNSKGVLISLGDKYNNNIIEEIDLVNTERYRLNKDKDSNSGVYIYYDVKGERRCTSVEDVTKYEIRQSYYWINPLGEEEVAWVGDIVYDFNTKEEYRLREEFSLSGVCEYVTSLDKLKPRKLKSTRPTLGMLPLYLHEETRIEDLCRAIMDRLLSDKPEIPIEWLDELTKKHFFDININSTPIKSLQFYTECLTHISKWEIFQAKLTIQDLTKLSLFILHDTLMKNRGILEEGCEELEYIRQILLPNLVKDDL